MRALRLVRNLPLFVLALAVPAGLVACSDGSSPTEPAPAVSAATAAAAAAPVVVAEEGPAARGGARAFRQEAMGGEAPRRAAAGAPAVRVAAAPASPVVGTPEAARGGNGKGKGGAKPKPAPPAKPEKPEKGGKGKPGGDLRLEIQPDVWNTNWARSNGTVTALIRGSNLGAIDVDSIVLVGTDGAAEELEPLRVQRVGNHVRAFFAKEDAFDTLDTPAPGEIHEIVVRLTIEGVADAPDVEKELKDTIRVVGPAT